MCDALGEGGLPHLVFVPLAGDWFLHERLRGDGVLSPAFPRPSRVASNALRTCAFQQLARRNQAAHAHGNAGDNGRGAKNDAPCSCALHCSLLLDVHCGLLGLDSSYLLSCLLRFSLRVLFDMRYFAFRFELFVLCAPCRSCLATAFPVSFCTCAAAFSCCAFSRSARARAFARRLRMFATVSSMP